MDSPVRPQAFRTVMRRFPTGVTVVAVEDRSGQPWGLTVSSFTSVSLDPPLVLICVDRASETHDRILDSAGFGVSVLAASQAPVATRFASDPSEGRFDDVAWRRGPAGLPLIEGASAWLECRVHGVVEGGDHSIILGAVHESGVGEAPSMVYWEGAFGSVES